MTDDTTSAEAISELARNKTIHEAEENELLVLLEACIDGKPHDSRRLEYLENRLHVAFDTKCRREYADNVRNMLRSGRNRSIQSERAAFALLLADLEGRVWYNFASKDLAAIRERAGL